MKVKESMKKRKIVITVCCMAALISGVCIYTAVQPDTVQAEQASDVTSRQEVREKTTEQEQEETQGRTEQKAEEKTESRQQTASEQEYTDHQSRSSTKAVTVSQKSKQSEAGVESKPQNAAENTKPVHKHSWEPVEGTEETEEKVPIIGDKCNTCDMDITGFAEEHILNSSCMGYSTDVVVRYEYKTVSKTIVTGYRCSCGATK